MNQLTIDAGGRSWRMGEAVEVFDHLNMTWITGIILNVYDCSTHPGCVCNILRPDGSTVQIDPDDAMICSAEATELSHIMRAFERYKYELTEKLRLIDRGITLIGDQTSCVLKDDCTYISPNGPSKMRTLMVVVNEGQVRNIQSKDYIGWLSTDQKRLILPFKVTTPCSPSLNLCALTIDGMSNSAGSAEEPTQFYITDSTTRGSVFAHNPAFLDCNEENIKLVKSELNDLCSIERVVPREICTVHLMNALYDESLPAGATFGEAVAQKDAEAIAKGEVTQKTVDKVNEMMHDYHETQAQEETTWKIPEIKVDDRLWDHMGWKPDGDKKKPMYTIGTRFLRKDNQQDKWCFLTNKSSTFGFVMVPMENYLSLQDLILPGFDPVDLVSSGDILFIDNVLGRWKDSLVGTFMKDCSDGRLPSSFRLSIIQLVPTKEL